MPASQVIQSITLGIIYECGVIHISSYISIYFSPLLLSPPLMSSIR